MHLLADISTPSPREAARAAGFDGVEIRLDPPSASGPSVPFDFPSASGIVQLRTSIPADDLRLECVAMMTVALARPANSVDASTSGPVVVAEIAANSRRGYAEVLAGLFDALREIGPAAEAAGVRIAVDPADSGYLSSPVEAAGLVDRVNSPMIGLAICADRVFGAATVRDWIEEAAGRLFCLRCSPSAPLQEEWVAALRRLRYNGSIVWRGEPRPEIAQELHRRLHEV